MENDQIEYKEIFERSDILEQDVQYKIASVKEAHPEEFGWIVGNAEVIKQPNGKCTVKIPLVKYAMNKEEEHSRHF